VLYVGRAGVPHAAEAVTAARQAGMRLAFVTNNASRAPEEVAEHLCRLGVDAAPDDVVTSGQAAARLVAERVPAGSAVLVVGSPALERQVAGAGLRPVRTLQDAGPGGPAAVVQGLWPGTTWRDLEQATVAVHRGALWVAGNVDSTLPGPDGVLPGNGTMVDAVRTATGREPVVAGKPEPALHEESVRRVGSRRPLVVGDRLDTDVDGAVRAGADCLLVLTGVVDLAALLTAPRGSRPSYVAHDLRALGRPQLPVQISGARATCGGWTAVATDGAVVADGSGQPDDALRAACAAAWAAADAGTPVRAASGLPAPAPPVEPATAGCGA